MYVGHATEPSFCPETRARVCARYLWFFRVRHRLVSGFFLRAPPTHTHAHTPIRKPIKTPEIGESRTRERRRTHFGTILGAGQFRRTFRGAPYVDGRQRGNLQIVIPREVGRPPNFGQLVRSSNTIASDLERITRKAICFRNSLVYGEYT